MAAMDALLVEIVKNKVSLEGFISTCKLVIETEEEFVCVFEEVEGTDVEDVFYITHWVKGSGWTHCPSFEGTLFECLTQISTTDINS